MGLYVPVGSHVCVWGCVFGLGVCACGVWKSLWVCVLEKNF